MKGVLEMNRMLVNYKFRLHVTTNSNFRKLLLLLFQYFPNKASQVKCHKVLPTLCRDKSVHFRKLEKFKFLDRRLCSKQSQYIISLLIAPSEGGKGFSPKKNISFRTYLNRERKSSWEAFQEGTQASYFTQFSTHPHRRWLKVSLFQRY